VKNPKILSILAHPSPRSFCKSIFEKGLDAYNFLNCKVTPLDLYAHNFLPALPLEELERGISFDPLIMEWIKEIQASQGFFFVFPEWWGGPPALLKGFFDRCFQPGVAYEYQGDEFEDKEKVGLLSGKKAIVALTTNAPFSLEDVSFWERLWKNKILGFCGIEEVEVLVFFHTYESEFHERQSFLKKIEGTIINQWTQKGK